jgi:hypothetical protein
MSIDQRNAGASTTPASNGLYTLDRWGVSISQGSKFSVQQNAGSVTPPTGFANYIGLTSTSAYTVGAGENFAITQPIEGFNFADMAWGTANAQTVTLSFWVRSSLTGTFGGGLLNSAQNRSYVFSYTINSANTWEQKSVTITGDTTGTWVGATNGIGVNLFLTIGAGSSVSKTAGSWGAGYFVAPTGSTSVVGTNGATFYVAGVQLEVGSTATSFDYRPYGTEFDLCRRYFERVNGFNARAASATLIAANVPCYPKRAAPTVSLTGALQITSYAIGSSTQSSASVTLEGALSDAAYVSLGNFSGLTSGAVYYNYVGLSNAIAFSAEL